MDNVRKKMSNDWQFLSRFFNILYYFGITPFLVNNFKQPISTRRRCYLILLQVIITSLSLLQLWTRYQITKTEQYFKEMRHIFNTVAIFTETIIFNLILLSSHFVKNWRRLFSFFTEDLEIYFENKVVMDRTLQYFYIRYGGLSVILIIIHAIEIYYTDPLHVELAFILSIELMNVSK